MATKKRLIYAHDLEAQFRKTKVIEIFPYWHELDFATKRELVKYGTKCKEIIMGAPTVDAVEVVHGRWLKTCIPDIYHCTNCKRATKMDELCDSEILRAYCPNCGAKMNGEVDG